MSSLWIPTLVLLLHPSILNTSNALQCSVPTEEKTRVFQDLADYKKNNVTFNAILDECNGTNVIINKIRETLQENDFETYESDLIIRMFLNNKGIHRIESNAFSQLHCLETLDLQENEIANLTPGTFNRLEHLRHLNLSRNHLDTVPPKVLTNLTHLKTLDLSGNAIKIIEQGAFDNLVSLYDLNLSGNQLTRFNLGELKKLVNLKVLDLSHNKLASIEFGGLIFNELTRLMLNSNQIRRLNFTVLQYEVNFFNGELATLRHGHTEDHIDCIEDVTSSTTETAATAKPAPVIDFSAILKQNNEPILEAISGLKSTVVTLIVFLCLFMVFEIAMRTGLLSRFINRNRQNEQIILDNSNIENIRLLNPN